MRPIALVTGGNRGIGRGIVLALARCGFDVTIADLAESDDTRETRRAAEALGARTGFVAADIADLAAHARIVEAAWALGGRLDTLVNNAGVSVAKRGDLLDVTPESFDRVLGVNLRGTFFLTQAVARRMLEDAPGEAHRSIVTISSSNAVIAAPERAEYAIAKTGLSMMTKVFAVRLAAAGLSAAPGAIEIDRGFAATHGETFDPSLPEEMMEVAKNRVREINTAYDRIKQARGFV